jgi:NADPH2:quinone reductase
MPISQASCRAAVVDPASRKLFPGEISMPRPGEGELLIEVAAAGVNRVDIDQKKGDYKVPAGVSPLLGLEVAGTVAALGAGATGYKPGDRVMALMSGGAYAEYAVARADLSLPIPDRMSFDEAAAVPEAYFTVWSNVFMDAKLKPGEVLLVHGGASGVGSATIQIAKSMGAVVITTARSEEKAEFCRKLGADLSINYREKDFEAEAARFLEGRGVDVVFDWIGHEYLKKHLSLLARKGRLVFIDSRTKEGPPIDLSMLMRKNLTITGSLLRPRPLEEKIAIAGEVRRRLLPKLESGEFTPIISHRVPFAAAEEAHAVVERGEHKGKVVLTFGSR